MVAPWKNSLCITQFKNLASLLLGRDGVKLFALTIPSELANSAKMERIRDPISIPILVHGESSQIKS